MRLHKYQKPNLKVKKMPTRPDSNPPHPVSCWTGTFFFDLQLWSLIFLQPLNLQGRTVPHLKYLIHICLIHMVKDVAWLSTCVILAQNIPIIQRVLSEQKLGAGRDQFFTDLKLSNVCLRDEMLKNLYIPWYYSSIFPEKKIKRKFWLWILELTRKSKHQTCKHYHGILESR